MSLLNQLFSILILFENFQLNNRIFLSNKNNNNNIIIFSYNFGTKYLNFLKKSIGFFNLSLVDIIGIDLIKLKNYSLFFSVQS